MRTPRLRPGSALLLSITVGATAVLLPARGRAAEDAAWLASRWAATDMNALAGAVRRWREEKGAWPASCAEAGAAYLQPAPKADPWGSPYSCSFENGKALVRSAGPDGRPGTADDLSLDAATAAPVAAAPAPSPGPAPVAPTPAAPAAPPSAEAAATLTTLSRLAEGLESFRKKAGHYPVAEKVEHLERWLVAEHLAPAAWTTQDGWGRPLRYRTTDVGSSYTLASAGADGRWEVLTGDGADGEGDADADLAVVDGRFVRWPQGLAPAAAGAPATAPRAEPAAAPEPKDPADVTRRRLEQLAALLASRREGGAWPQSDDAERLVRDLGARTPAVDGWGRPLAYQSASGGRHFALASAGPDGRFGTDIEALARGAAPAGDDVVVRDGAFVGAAAP